MGNRRKSRELAMQALFYMDMSQDDSNEMLERFCDNFSPPEKMLPFFLNLVKGVIREKGEIDSILKRFSDHWKLNRMSCVDRNTMRVAIYELLYCHDIPHKVSINEAIDMGKKFGSKESGAFINGILDSIRIAIEKKEIHVKDTIQ
ncbi:MAG: transcription antitermination factor NusB [Deltaproteobacteria bacterium]|nr:transcription antitermination factor NusB [Deltaproteobacteria bacterium]MBW2598049.1 transcription antitermination factor NusB [Deltaproteobacteria bacterium]MBW2639062.1 transcription antitermination factor NusB [Deltaproteobacteria bacterium]MBW2679628.1 transcription antitermination factor NusB [Deltaproteobacteria bacterium]